MGFYKKAATLGFAVLTPILLAADTQYSSEDYLTGDWGGARDSLHQDGVDVGLDYTAEPASNVAGGYKNRSTYLHNINAQLEFDLDKLVGLPATTFLAKMSSRVGDNLSEKYVAPASTSDGRYAFGSYFNKSQEAYGGQTTKLVNAQFTTSLSDSLKVDYGRVVMNDIFLRSDIYCDFMNNVICGSPKGVFTPYALDAYPDATFGVDAQWNVVEPVNIILGVYDGSWNSINDRNGLDWTLGKNGQTYAAEAQYYLERGDVYGEQKVLKIGINHNTGKFSKYTGGTEKGITSTYVLADIGVYAEVPGQGLSISGSYVHNDNDDLAGLPNLYMIGAVYKGLIPGRDRDKLGVNYSYADHSKENTYTSNYISGYTRDGEQIIELSYNLVLPRGIEVMPDFQYITNPNGQNTFEDATIIGLKVNINF